MVLNVQKDVMTSYIRWTCLPMIFLAVSYLAYPAQLEPQKEQSLCLSDCTSKARDKQTIVHVYLKRVGAKYYQHMQYCNQKSFKSGIE